MPIATLSAKPLGKLQVKSDIMHCGRQETRRLLIIKAISNGWKHFFCLADGCGNLPELYGKVTNTADNVMSCYGNLTVAAAKQTLVYDTWTRMSGSVPWVDGNVAWALALLNSRMFPGQAHDSDTQLAAGERGGENRVSLSS